MKFVIDRALWDRGRGDSETLPQDEGAVALKHPGTDCRCCLGFCALAYGFTEEEIDGVADPSELLRQMGNFSEPGESTQLMNTQLSVRAIVLNDDDGLTGPEREAALIALFAEHGHEVVFDGPREWVLFDSSPDIANGGQTYHYGAGEWGSDIEKAERYESTMLAQRALNDCDEAEILRDRLVVVPL